MSFVWNWHLSQKKKGGGEGPSRCSALPLPFQRRGWPRGAAERERKKGAKERDRERERRGWGRTPEERERFRMERVMKEEGEGDK